MPVFARQPLESWPFLVGAVAAFATLPLGAHETTAGRIEAAVATVLTVVVAGSLLVRLPPRLRLVRALPLLAAFAAIALLRDAEGGATSGYGSLVLLPVFWLALHGERRDVLASLLLVGALFVVPILADPSRYPSAEWRRALIWLVVTPVVGLTTHGLVENVRKSARVDALTGLPNRRAWEDRLPLALEEASRNGRPLSVAMFDLDGFKAYNDTHGHPAGDRLLVDAAAAWQREIRAVDLLARLGGDEFALLLPGAPLVAAEAVVARAAAVTPHVRLSAGVAEWRRGDGAAALVERADTALYRNKGLRRRKR